MMTSAPLPPKNAVAFLRGMSEGMVATSGDDGLSPPIVFRVTGALAKAGLRAAGAGVREGSRDLHSRGPASRSRSPIQQDQRSAGGPGVSQGFACDGGDGGDGGDDDDDDDRDHDPDLFQGCAPDKLATRRRGGRGQALIVSLVSSSPPHSLLILLLSSPV